MKAHTDNSTLQKAAATLAAKDPSIDAAQSILGARSAKEIMDIASKLP